MKKGLFESKGIYGQGGFNLLEAIILIILVALMTAFLTDLLRSGTGKITRSAIDSLVKAECGQVTRPIGDGSFDLTVGEIAEFGVADLAGPSLVVKKVKVKWKYNDGRCSYVLEITGTDPDDPSISTTMTSDESVLDL